MECPLEVMRDIKRDTRDDLAIKFRVNTTTIYRWETNKMIPSAENFLQIAEYLELSVGSAIRMWLDWSKTEKGETVEQIINS
jgi:transcriptional regulator with XRE-family HTH domain